MFKSYCTTATKNEIIIERYDFFNSSDNEFQYGFYVMSPISFSGEFIIAIYDKEYRFIEYITKNLKSVTEADISGTIKSDKKPEYFKAFLWSSLKPIANLDFGKIEY